MMKSSHKQNCAMPSINFCELDGSNSSQSDEGLNWILFWLLAANHLPAANSDIHTLQKQVMVKMNETELTIGNITYWLYD